MGCVRCDNPADDTPAEKLATVTDQTKAMLTLFYGFEVPAPGGGEAAETSADSNQTGATDALKLLSGRQLITSGTDANGYGGGNGCKCISDVCVMCANPADDTPQRSLP